MAETMLKQLIEITSETYNIKGVIRDYGVVTKLCFNYEGKDYELGIRINPLLNEDLEIKGKQIMESCINNLISTKRKVMLHDWYIEDHLSHKGYRYDLAHGYVSGHNRLPDSIWINTSRIESVQVDYANDELLIQTVNTLYHCPLNSCRWHSQDKFPDRIPDYEQIKEAYKGKTTRPTIEPGKVLLVLANYSHYYFHSLYCKPEGCAEPIQYESDAHIGVLQDSFLIYNEMDIVDLRYYPHALNIEFYSEYTNGMPLYIENIGDVTLYAKTSVGTIKLEPGDRKEVTKDNTESNPPVLPNGDLYSAGI